MSVDSTSNPMLLMQVGIVVRDVDASAVALERILGVAPFHLGAWPPQGREDIKRYYYGEPGDFTMKQAFFNFGNVEIELIQPLTGKNIWFDFLEKHGQGIHHVRFNVPDIDKLIGDMQTEGVGVTQWGFGWRPGTKWANFDTEEAVGFIIEAMNVLPGTDGRTPKSTK